MRPRRMSRLTLPVVLIAAVAAFPAGASASVGFVPSGPDAAAATSGFVPPGPVAAGSSMSVQQSKQDLGSQAAQPEPSASDGFEWTDAAIVAAIALGLLCVAGATVLLATHTRRRTA
jgi:hypothetical protein